MVESLADEHKSAMEKYSKRQADFSPTKIQFIKLQGDRCKGVLEEHSKSIYNYPNVIGAGIGLKYKSKEVLDQPCIVIYVTKKILDLKEGAIPKEIDGCITDVIETTVPRALSAANPGPVCPLTPGYSIGHENFGYGTLGCIVKDNGVSRTRAQYSNLLLLSCCHVLAPNYPAEGDSILHPGNGSTNNPLTPPMRCASLLRWKFLVPYSLDLPLENEIDAAVAKPIVPFTPEIQDIGLPRSVSTINSSMNGWPVQLTGAQSGFQRGVIISISSGVPIDYGPGLGLIRFKNCIQISNMGQRGDSGALLLDSSRNALGLLIGGESAYSYCCDLKKTLADPDINAALVTSWP